MSIDATVMKIRELFADGFQLADLPRAAELAYAEIREGNLAGLLDSTERTAAVLAILDRVIDETDAPGPDWLVDPATRMIAHAVVPGIVAWVERLLPGGPAE